jgi:hypothetical protein
VHKQQSNNAPALAVGQLRVAAAGNKGRDVNQNKRTTTHIRRPSAITCFMARRTSLSKHYSSTISTFNQQRVNQNGCAATPALTISNRKLLLSRGMVGTADHDWREVASWEAPCNCAASHTTDRAEWCQTNNQQLLLVQADQLPRRLLSTTESVTVDQKQTNGNQNNCVSVGGRCCCSANGQRGEQTADYGGARRQKEATSNSRDPPHLTAIKRRQWQYMNTAGSGSGQRNRNGTLRNQVQQTSEANNDAPSLTISSRRLLGNKSNM